jgi:hypothetical protein
MTYYKVTPLDDAMARWFVEDMGGMDRMRKCVDYADIAGLIARARAPEKLAQRLCDAIKTKAEKAVSRAMSKLFLIILNNGRDCENCLHFDVALADKPCSTCDMESFGNWEQNPAEPTPERRLLAARDSKQ